MIDKKPLGRPPKTEAQRIMKDPNVGDEGKLALLQRLERELAAKELRLADERKTLDGERAEVAKAWARAQAASRPTLGDPVMTNEPDGSIVIRLPAVAEAKAA